jgi:signal transduction histidine kinase
VEHPDRWHRDQLGHRGPFGRHGPFGLRERHTGHGGPLRREQADRLGGGVAAGIAAWRGFSPTTVRIVFVLVTLVSTGWGVPLYVLAWLFIPAAGAEANIFSKARTDAGGIRLAVGLASLLIFVLLVAGALNGGWFIGWASPQVFSVAGLALIWRNGAEDGPGHAAAPARAAGRRDGRRATEPPVGAAPGHRRRADGRRAGLAVLGPRQPGAAPPARRRAAGDRGHRAGPRARGGCGSPGTWRWSARAKGRAEERLDIAARVHDSVLQTLALIQRRADDPQKVIQLARMQERELRSWLFEGRDPDEADEELTVAAGVRKIQQDVEARYGVPVEAVTVGDCDLDDNLTALLAAAGEATVNAAKWSGAGVISLFAEVEPGEVSIVVRDRGKGFDPEAVPEDRKGLAESVHGRMTRRGGTATVTTAPGEGTKVTLKMPRSSLAQRGGLGGSSPRDDRAGRT